MARKEITNEVLKGLYYGEYDVIEESLSEVDGYKERLHNLNEKRAIVDKALNSSQKELLTQYLAIYTELEAILQFHYFSRGWELGVKFKAATE